jgi:4-hydroxy-2-oxoheptanedioate aldolase
MHQPFQRLLDSTSPVIGTWSQFRDPEPVDILFDFTIIDIEHGCFGLATAETLVRPCDAGDLVPLVRVPANEGWMITKALDIGVAAVVPRIATPEAAARAITAARYGVEGGRGTCPCIRAA